MRIREFLNIIGKKNDGVNLCVGDIIWAKRYKNEVEKFLIKKGHQESPYVVIKKVRGKVYVLQCTSNPHQKYKKMYYPLEKFIYNMNKNSYVNCLKVYELDDKQFVKKMGSLTIKDLNQLKKQLYILSHSNLKIKPEIEDKYLDFKLDIGDVICFNKHKYFIFDMNRKWLYVYRIRKNSKKSKMVRINNMRYSFIFEKVEMIKRKAKFSLIATFNTGEVDIINKFKHQYLKRVNKKEKNLRVGALIEYQEEKYYVYDEKDEEVLAYRVYVGEDVKTNMGNIKINGGIYKTYFAKVLLKKDRLNRKGYKIIRYASYEEIEYNKKLVNLSKEERKIEKRKLFETSMLSKDKNINIFVPMVVLENENNKKFYLIINREKNIIEVVNINDIGDKFYFELEEGNCPFRYYSVLAKEEYDKYLEKIDSLKEMVKMFDNGT